MPSLSLDDHLIFNDDAFAQALSISSHPLNDFKTAVSHGRDALKQAFESGSDTIELVRTRAEFIDRILIAAFDHCFNNIEQSIALLAVGGYGRGELHPASDVDLMILLNEKESTNTRHAIEQFLMLLWDSKLEIGHSVRTINECIDEARADITVATNIMEARHLAGDKQLTGEMKGSTGPDQIWDSPSFFQAKLDEQIKRHAKFHDTAYNLEPNIKENPGGLRDIQMIGWVAKRHFGANTLHELVDHDFLTEKEYQALIDGQTLLWQIRLALHHLTGRREDRLLFDLQRELAIQFGYTDGENNLAIETFMQRYYRTVMELERLNELLLQLFREAILYKDQIDKAEIINQRFQLINGYIEVRYPEVFIEHPTALLELFLIMEKKPEICGVRAHTIRLVREHSHLIDETFRQSETAKLLFMDILSQPRGVTHEMRRMNRYGILAAYIPAFEQIVGRMQYDLFHAYTVDQHTLFVVRNMRRLSVPEFSHEYPLASGIFHHLPKPELLYLAGLFHDIAKGRGGRHEELGAIDAEAFCLAHGLNEADSQQVGWLVRKHLLMSMVAQRKDISDPEIVSAFTKEIETQVKLDYLYLLTMCDIRATNPKQWNSWKDNLLSELYHKASSALRIGTDNPVNREAVIHEAQTSAQRLLSQKGFAPERINELWRHFNDDYFLHHSRYEIKWHTQLILDRAANNLPITAARESDKGQIEIFVYTDRQHGLFARIATTIDQLGLTIVDAQLMTTDNKMYLDTFKVLEKDGMNPNPEFRIKEITDRLTATLSDSSSPLREHKQEPSRLQKHFTVSTEVNFEQLPGKDITVLNIITNDRPGLLARIAHAFLDCDIRIHNAKIATAGEKANDTFYITNRNDPPLLDQNTCQRLETTLKEYLSE
ncbi:MAG: [protein-PII] uridylyltransferase [Gammaproteobacteria bacterium]|nr:[protein-PII] uridylyltransferase [Gammaproteobacteria bacterium]MCW8910998.1 [protein-PII] uridylyltransferase [Gammaproteobacteria bacterium]MCW9004755.1 [protein-PII] uridylyltransferase [Gammaproteobacteria bacterium]MCW9056116.1 [protein-PII] uridylyltransferase [Gammaproteobacteria bacterium]